MNRTLVFFVVMNLITACATRSVAVKHDANALSASPQNTVTRSSVKTRRAASRHRGFCDKAEVEWPIRRRVHDIQACYEDELLMGPDFSGRVDVSWTIGEDGRVVEIATTGLKEVGACVAEVIKSIRFAPPNIGCEVVSRYPFVFKLQ